MLEIGTSLYYVRLICIFSFCITDFNVNVCSVHYSKPDCVKCLDIPRVITYCFIVSPAIAIV